MMRLQHRSSDRSPLYLWLFVCAMIALGATPGHAASPSASMDGAVAQAIAAHPRSGVAVIARLGRPLTPSRRAALRSLGAVLKADLPLIHSVALRVPARNLPRLAVLPFITHLSYDGQVGKCDAFTVGSSGAGAVCQKYGLTGQGVGVAVLDTGVHAVNDLAQTTKAGPSRVVANVGFSAAGTDDLCGHGTHVAGIIAGNGAASTGPQCFRTFYGIARQAGIINVKVLGDQGQGCVSDVVAGLQWTVANKSAYNIRVVNLSLGHPVGESYKTDPLCQAVEAAWRAGIVVVCAAGNGGRLNSTNTPGLDNEGWGTNYGSIASPGDDPCVITVGAMKQNVLSSGAVDANRADDRIATYSSRGPTRLDLLMKPDLVAPGNRVISTLAAGSYLAQTYGPTNEVPYSLYTTQNAGRLSQDYFRLSGTSMATPVVAGAAALMLQKDPTLTPDTVKARLMITADKWTDPSGNADPLTYGAGYLDIPAAIASPFLASRPAVSPSLYRDGQGGVWFSPTGLLSGGSLWGTGLGDLRVIWGTQAVLSSGTLTDSRVIWGTSVWTNTSVCPVISDSVDLSGTAIKGE